jgi:hypothetical protein
VADYRLYFLDEAGRIQQGVDLECATDEEAIEVAEQHRDGHDLELWSGARVVHKFRKLPKSHNG